MTRQKTRGQMSVLIVLSLIPVFTLFAFVVNVGMLVNAKIALQNAADLAAYSGAATQARQLTHIAHLNYQLRQAYKKFLFRYYVLGNMSLRCFPTGSGTSCAQNNGHEPSGAEKFDWLNPGGSYPGLPSVCVSVSNANNVCQLTEAGVPVVQAPPCFPTDPICQQLQQTAQQIANIQIQSCKANTAVNEELLTMWLYATSKNNQLQTQANLSQLVDDLGLVTENITTYQRIQTVMNEYINAPPQTGVTTKTEQNMESAPDEAVFERTILAFNTARYNLNENVFDPDTIQMTELLPQPNQQLKLTAIQPTFQTMYSIIDVGQTNAIHACAMDIQKLSAHPYVGVYKDPTSRVYYAVKLTARAKILFNPFPFGNPSPDIELTAYAAAQPFGSRIGPQLSESSFTKTVQHGNQSITYPTLPVSADGNQYTMESGDVLKELYGVLRSNTPSGDTLSTNAIQSGVQAAQLPDEFEIGNYDIPADLEVASSGGSHAFDNAMTEYYNRGDGSYNPEYTFWAPLQSAALGGDINQIRDTIQKEIQANISLTTTANDSSAALAAYLQSQLNSFLNSLKSQNNFNVARMIDPLGQYLFASQPPSIIKKITTLKDTASSYATDHDATLYSQGRDGYSVKFIPLQSLFTNTGNGGNTDSVHTLQPFAPIRDTLSGTVSDLGLTTH